MSRKVPLVILILCAAVGVGFLAGYFVAYRPSTSSTVDPSVIRRLHDEIKPENIRQHLWYVCRLDILRIAFRYDSGPTVAI